VNALDLYENTARRVGACDQRIDGETFRLELVELLDSAASQPGAGRAAAVRVARLADVAGDALDLLVVLDANEGVLPREDAQDALVSENLAETIAKASRGAFVPPARGAVRARDLTALAVAAAEATQVVLITTSEDSAGAPVGPSPVVDALERAGIPVLDAEPEVVRRSGMDVRIRVAREREREGFFLDPNRPRSPVVGAIGPGGDACQVLATETGGADRPLAVTGLERLARCPFMGYAHVVLAARDSVASEELPDAREEGTLIHEALAAAFVATSSFWQRRPRARDQILSLGAAAAEVVLDRFRGHAPLRSIVRLRVRDAVTAVLASAIEEETWDFAFAEQPFGSPGGPTWPPLTLADGTTRLALRGSVDRVDRGHDGQVVRVIDYKRTKATVQAASRGLGETALQVPLYACVASRQLGLPGTGAYAATQARDVGVEGKGSVRTAAQVEELCAREAPGELAPVESRALAIVRDLRAGGLAPFPASEAECRYCDVSGGCRKPRFAMTPADDSEEDARGPVGDVF
jgi:RecB family exonuclease